MIDNSEDIVKRLNVLIKLEISRVKKELGTSFNLQEPAKMLQSCGLSPSEIASLLDKNGPTSVAYLLYDKKDKQKNSKKEVM